MLFNFRLELRKYKENDERRRLYTKELNWTIVLNLICKYYVLIISLQHSTNSNNITETLIN